MSERLPPDPQGTAPEDPGGLGPEARQLNWVERYDVAQRASGILAPVLTALLAFFVGGIIVLITTGKNPTRRVALSNQAGAIGSPAAWAMR